jgi:DNA-binding SARP family transcriptional activator
VVNRHRHIPRDELAEALWREPEPAAVDARLNPLLSKLRRVFDADAVDGRSTIRAGRQLTRVAPLRESGYRYLMQALAAQGNLAEALGVYGQLSECLRDQLGVSPSPATRELYERLLAAT